MTSIHRSSVDDTLCVDYNAVLAYLWSAVRGILLTFPRNGGEKVTTASRNQKNKHHPRHPRWNHVRHRLRIFNTRRQKKDDCCGCGGGHSRASFVVVDPTSSVQLSTSVDERSTTKPTWQRGIRKASRCETADGQQHTAVPRHGGDQVVKWRCQCLQHRQKDNMPSATAPAPTTDTGLDTTELGSQLDQGSLCVHAWPGV